jgi:hypothetical protein
MGTDPLFPAAALLPLGGRDAVIAMAQTSLTFADGVFKVDDFSCYHNETEPAR